MSLETARLSLEPCVPAHLLALLQQPECFEQLTGVPAAVGLRERLTSAEVSPDWLAALRRAPGPDPGRHGFFLVHRGARTVIGSAGFKGPPDSTSAVEIAYGIAPGCPRSRPHPPGGQRLDPRPDQVRISPRRHGRRPGRWSGLAVGAESGDMITAREPLGGEYSKVWSGWPLR